MPYASFFSEFPDIAERETRTVTLTKACHSLPANAYAFVELYCDERGCDCRRVFLNVVSPSSNEALAVIAYGWESRDYYIKWMGDDDSLIIDSMMGPTLNMASQQTALAMPLLALFREVLLPDRRYMERIKRHYDMFREKVEHNAIRPAQSITGSSRSRSRRLS
jgi:hypothetical protein